MKIKSFLSQVFEQTDLTPVEKVKILAAKLKDIDVQFTSTISDLSQHHQMMTNWYNNLKKNWPKLHDSTNSDGNGHCLIIKRDENDPDVEIGFWLGEDNATGILPGGYFHVFFPKQKETSQIICMIQKKSISLHCQTKNIDI